jgi:voltage-gated potassium channel
VPVTAQARWFAMSLLVIGLGVFASAIASAVGPKISGEINRLFNPKKKTMEPKDHVILVGEGAIASNTAEELKRRNVAFIRIMTTNAAAGTGNPPSDVIEGDATNDGVLQQAGILHARMVIAAREDDGENAFISLVAKDLNPNIRVLAVASSQFSIRRLKLARADIVFSPAAVGSRLLADLVEGGRISPAFEDLLEGHSHKS